MIHEGTHPPEYTGMQYMKTLRSLQNNEAISGKEPETADIITQIIYLQQKYTRKIQNIMDIASLLEHVSEKYPGEMYDIDMLSRMRHSILQTLNEQANYTPSHATMTEYAPLESVPREILEQRYKILVAILNSTSQGAWLVDKEFKILYANAAICQMFGYTQRELEGHILFDFFEGDNKRVLMKKARLMETTEHRDYILDLPRKDGSYMPVKILATTIRVDGELVGGVAFLTDITDFRNEEKKLQQEALRLHKKSITDALTGVYNRRCFDEKLENSFQKLNNGEISCISLALIDADYFKKINDLYGHAIGDHVLKYMGTVLLSLEIPGISVFRYGGEEFAIIGKSISLEKMSEIAEDIRQKIERTTITFPGGSLQFTISIGIESYKYEIGIVHAVRPFFKSADSRLYAAKASGRNRVEPNVPLLMLENNM